jgi:hypothetical protein
VSDERPDPILNMLQAIRVEQSAQREKLDEIIVRLGSKRRAEKRSAFRHFAQRRSPVSSGSALPPIHPAG